MTDHRLQALLDQLPDDPRLRAQFEAASQPILDVITGKTSAISHIVEHSGVDERTVIAVLQQLEFTPMPDAAQRYLLTKGFKQEDLSRIDIGAKRLAEALVLQHCGLLDEELGDDREAADAAE